MPEGKMAERASNAVTRIFDEILVIMGEEADRSHVPMGAVSYYLWVSITDYLMVAGFDAPELQEIIARRFTDGVKQGFIKTREEKT